MTTNIPYDDAGMAGSWTDDFASIPLFSGEAPIVTTPEKVSANAIATADLPAFTVVGRSAIDGSIIPAVWGTNDAIGITCSTVKAGTQNATVAIYRGGMFNPAALNWPSSYSTDARKKQAFEKLGQGIFIRALTT